MSAKQYAFILFALLSSCVVKTETVAGERGETGPEGETGPPGATGPDGETGPPGQPGVSPFSYVDESMADIFYSGGKVGIGTPNPSALFEISNMAPDALRFNVTATNSTYGENGGIVWQGYYSGTTTPFNAVAIKRFNLEDNNGATNKQRLGFYVREPTTDGALLERMTIRENGHVGIGTLDPEARLTVLNPTLAAGDQIIASFQRYRTTTGTDGLYVYDDGAGDGNTTVSTVKLRSTGANSCNLGLGPVGTELLISTTGNVGIGTTTPRATLDINGTARLAKQSSAPGPCTATNDGTIALNGSYRMCVCNGSAWVYAHDGNLCIWQ